MLKVNQKTLDEMERQHEGILKTIMRFENAELPACPQCASEDTAAVQVGVIGRTIYIATATSKFTLIPNGPRPGKYRCNSCKQYFGEVEKSDGEISGFTLRPRDTSLQAFKDFSIKAAGHLGVTDDGSTSEEEWEKRWRAFWKTLR